MGFGRATRDRRQGRENTPGKLFTTLFLTHIAVWPGVGFRSFLDERWPWSNRRVTNVLEES